MGVAGIVTIQRESFRSFIVEARELVGLHAAEMNPHPDIPPDVDEDIYLGAEEKGAVRVYVARLDGVMIGYLVFIVQFALNWKLSLTATQTAFFVDPSARMSTAGSRLIHESERWLRDEGVQVVTQQQFTKHPALGRLLERSGYEHSTNVWTKRLDKGN